MILVSHDPGYVKAHCEHAAVLVDGKLTTFDEIDGAFEFYRASTV
jgi:capsular polysaccharide transport system ATP-binding protein